jgi:hypothetical protein
MTTVKTATVPLIGDGGRSPEPVELVEPADTGREPLDLILRRLKEVASLLVEAVES